MGRPGGGGEGHMSGHNFNGDGRAPGLLQCPGLHAINFIVLGRLYASFSLSSSFFLFFFPYFYLLAPLVGSLLYSSCLIPGWEHDTRHKIYGENNWFFLKIEKFLVVLNAEKSLATGQKLSLFCPRIMRVVGWGQTPLGDPLAVEREGSAQILCHVPGRRWPSAERGPWVNSWMGNVGSWVNSWMGNVGHWSIVEWVTWVTWVMGQ